MRDVVMTESPDGSLEFDVDEVNGVALGDILGIGKHSISYDGDRIIHQIAYADGSVIDLTIRKLGQRQCQIEYLEITEGCVLKMTETNVLVVYPKSILPYLIE